MARIEVSRAVAAQPSSVALVLAGPAARDLWPGRKASGLAVVAAQGSALDVSVDPPTRSGVGFTAHVEVRAGEDTVGSGRLTIVPAPAERGGCDVRLALTATDTAEARLRRAATRYLGNVADVSRERSSAA